MHIAVINEEYNVKKIDARRQDSKISKILDSLRTARLTLNNTEGVRSSAEVVEIEKEEKTFCEIILDSSDDEDEEEEEEEENGAAGEKEQGRPRRKEKDEDVSVIADPKIKILEQTQVRKVAEQLSSAGECFCKKPFPYVDPDISARA